jgi:hypothetical protein
MSLLKKRLELVDFKDLLCRVCFRIQIGDQWKDAIRFLFVAHGLLVDPERDGVNVFPGGLLGRIFGRTPFLLLSAFVFPLRMNLIFDQHVTLRCL